MVTLNNNAMKLPIVDSRFINAVSNVRCFLYENIYNDKQAMDILNNLFINILDPFELLFTYSDWKRVIMIKLKKTNVKKVMDEINTESKYFVILNIFYKFFNENPYILEKLSNCPNRDIIDFSNYDTLSILIDCLELFDNRMSIYL